MLPSVVTTFEERVYFRGSRVCLKKKSKSCRSKVAGLEWTAAHSYTKLLNTIRRILLILHDQDQYT